MIMRAIGMMGAALVLLASPVQAADKLDCKNAETTYELDQCAGKDFQAADGKLNSIYKQLMSKYDNANQSLLKTAQRNWLSFRDSECIYETNDTVGGSMNAMMFTACKTEKTNARVKELNAQLHCEEGDMSCNPPQ
jgi:uncharacterized protein YecT (DUF1311 family)